jgi:hypothetical protein
VAFSTDLVNVSPRGSVRLFVEGDTHEVAHEGTLTVTPETAGVAPHWRQADDDDLAALNVNPLAVHWRIRAGNVEVFDLGSGLLAQAETWRKVGDTSDPADPTADGYGGVIDPAAQLAALREAQQKAMPDAANDTTETESI